MREPRKDGAVDTNQEVQPEVKKTAGRPPKVKVEEKLAQYTKESKSVPNPYSSKIVFERFDGDMSKLPAQQFDSKGKPFKETKLQVIQRSRFFANFVNGKYKIIMVYKSRGNNKHHAKFDIIKPKKDKLKLAFFKSKGIIF